MPDRRDPIRNSVLMIAGLAPLLFGGCIHKTVQAAAPVSVPHASDVHPMTVAPDTDENPPLETAEVAPSLPTAPPKTPTNLATEEPVVPPPRRPAASQSNNEEASEQDAVSRPQPPAISPEISPSDQATYQRKTEDDSAVATKNLQAVGGHTLNATEQDMVQKIREALSEANNAGRQGDWVRAQNLAHTARALSDALVQSLQ